MKIAMFFTLAGLALCPFIGSASADDRLYDRLNGPGRATGTGGYDPSNDWDYYQRHDAARLDEGRSSGYGRPSWQWQDK